MEVLCGFEVSFNGAVVVGYWCFGEVVVFGGEEVVEVNCWWYVVRC
jgi:hypothetical protein